MYDPTKPYKTKINKYIEQTWNSKYCMIQKNGLYSIIKNIRNPENSQGYEIHHTDGIGTKGIYHWINKSFHNAVCDALYMNVNDLLMSKAHPYAIQNHLFLPEDNHQEIEDIIVEMSAICKQHGIVITGGETSIHNNMQGMEISITINGRVNDLDIEFKNMIKEDDIIVGYKSNGLHSNGFTKIRELIPLEKIINNPIALNLLCLPTKNYYLKANCHGNHINGMMHITGGAFSKIKDILPTDLNAYITGMGKAENENSRMFKKLYEIVKDDEEMYKIFNCGIGFVFTTSIHNIEKLVNDGHIVIGHVAKGTGKVIISSQFSNKIIEL